MDEKNTILCEQWIENATDEEISLVANKKCILCKGNGMIVDDPSPPGVGLAPGYETYICDCLDHNKVLEIIRGD